MASNNAFKFNGGLPSPERQAQLVQLARIREAAAHANEYQRIKTLAREIAKAEIEEQEHAKRSKAAKKGVRTAKARGKRGKKDEYELNIIISEAKARIKKGMSAKQASEEVIKRHTTADGARPYSPKYIQNILSKPQNRLMRNLEFD